MILNCIYLSKSVSECVEAAKDRSKSGVCDLKPDGTTVLLILSTVTSGALFAGSLSDMLSLKDKLRKHQELEKALEASTAELLAELKDSSFGPQVMNKVHDIVTEQAKRRASVVASKVHPDTPAERRTSLGAGDAVASFYGLAP